MKKSLIGIILLLLLVNIIPITAQSSACDVDNITDRVDSAYTTYEDTRSSDDTATSLTEVQGLVDELNTIINECRDAIALSSSDSDDPGSGTLADPFRFNQFADSGDGILIRVSGFVRPADRIIRNENMFNDRPDDGEEYVIVFVDVQCASSRSENCEVNSFDFELAGDNGVIYEDTFVVYDDELDVNVRPGSEGSGGLPFLIQSDDTNLQLIFYPEGMFSDDQAIYSAEPSAADGVTVVSTSSLNVRGGPSTNFGVVASLQSGEETIAFGRNGDGTWLQIQTGWVFAELVSTSGDVMNLPVTSE